MSVKYWTGHSDLYEIDYDGGAHSPVANEQIAVNGVESTEYATIQCWTNAGGWGGAGSGKLWVYDATTAFIANLENNDVIEDSGGTKICDTTGGVTARATGDWSSAYRWGSGEAPSVPADDDEVIFDGRSDLLPTEGMLDSESGAAGAFDLLHFKESYTAGVGSASEPLCCNPDKIVIDGTGTYYILCGRDDQDTAASIPITIIDNPDATVYLYSNNTAASKQNKFDDVYVLAGTLTAAFYSADTTDVGCNIVDLFMSPRNGKASNVTVTIEKDAFFQVGVVGTNVYMNDGTLTSDSIFADCILRRGTINFGTDLTTTPETAMNITTLRQHGGTFNWYPDATDGPTITAAWMFGGSFVASATTNNDRSKTIATMYMFEGSTVDLENNKGNITVTSLYKHGGTLTTDVGSKHAVTYNQP